MGIFMHLHRGTCGDTAYLQVEHWLCKVDCYTITSIFHNGATVTTNACRIQLTKQAGSTSETGEHAFGIR